MKRPVYITEAQRTALLDALTHEEPKDESRGPRDETLHPILVKIPKWIVKELDLEATRLGGIPRVNVIISELAKRAEAMRARRRGK